MPTEAAPGDVAESLAGTRTLRAGPSVGGRGQRSPSISCLGGVSKNLSQSGKQFERWKILQLNHHHPLGPGNGMYRDILQVYTQTLHKSWHVGCGSSHHPGSLPVTFILSWTVGPVCSYSGWLKKEKQYTTILPVWWNLDEDSGETSRLNV